MSTDPTPPKYTPAAVLSFLRDWRMVIVAVVLSALALAGWGQQIVGWWKGGAVGPPPAPPVVERVEVPTVAADAPPPNAFGWVKDEQAVKAVQGKLRFKVFGETPAGVSADPLPRQAYLWAAHRSVTGSNPPAMDQNPVGSCVSFGTSRAFERSLAVAILKGERFEFKHLCEEAVYGGSRVEVGGGRIRGDGSVGAWAAEWVRDWGGLPRGVYGRHDLTKYDPARCRQWGGSGVPDELEPEAKKYPAGSTTLVRNWDEAKRALANGSGIAGCSDQGFSRQRDSRGVCRAQGSWAHCMCLDGYHTDEQGREYGHIENSWGPDYHVGPVGWGEPSTAGFWAESKVIDRMLKAGDSWAFSAVKGFPVGIDWDLFIRAVPNRRQLFADADRPLYALAP